MFHIEKIVLWRYTSVISQDPLQLEDVGYRKQPHPHSVDRLQVRSKFCYYVLQDDFYSYIRSVYG